MKRHRAQVDSDSLQKAQVHSQAMHMGFELSVAIFFFTYKCKIY
jgi:hypothetical protein